jgi:hypothetical protein
MAARRAGLEADLVSEVWAPTLQQVAEHIPRRTRDVSTPGSDTQLGTFSGNTTPTDVQAQSVIDDATNTIISAAGQMPPVTDPNYALVTTSARIAAEWRAAADIEVAYPVRDADVKVFAQLDQRAKDALTALIELMAHTETGAVEPVPIWMSPDPPPWADTSPGSGVNLVSGQVF